MRTRSFRYENYTNRRAFLRSYPLQWGADDESNRDMARVIDQHDQERPTKKIIQDDKYKRPVKKIILTVLHWGGDKVLFFRRFKHKLTLYANVCVPAGLKTPNALLSA
ncbi:hypothetical protein I3843_06G095100 [Carya illinoinensis]|nr:hypothetical protein I3843_06G095100 [Carya illinoinensis]